MASRQDSLLSKLKTAVGQGDSKSTPQPSQTYKQPPLDLSKYAGGMSNQPKNAGPSYQRNPLAPISTNHSIQMRTADFKEAHPSIHQTPSFSMTNYEIRRQAEPKPLEPVKIDQNLVQYDSMRSQLAKRYSIPLKQSEKASYSKPEPEKASTNVATARHYRGEVEARRKMLENDATVSPVTVLPVSARKQYGTVKDITSKYQQTAVEQKRHKQKVVQDKENKEAVTARVNSKQRASSSEPNKKSAIAKLRKITELNDKINDRIRNIINVFDDNPC